MLPKIFLEVYLNATPHVSTSTCSKHGILNYFRNKHMSNVIFCIAIEISHLKEMLWTIAYGP